MTGFVMPGRRSPARRMAGLV